MEGEPSHKPRAGFSPLQCALRLTHRDADASPTGHLGRGTWGRGRWDGGGGHHFLISQFFWAHKGALKSKAY